MVYGVRITKYESMEARTRSPVSCEMSTNVRNSQKPPGSPSTPTMLLVMVQVCISLRLYIEIHIPRHLRAWVMRCYALSPMVADKSWPVGRVHDYVSLLARSLHSPIDGGVHSTDELCTHHARVSLEIAGQVGFYLLSLLSKLLALFTGAP